MFLFSFARSCELGPITRCSPLLGRQSWDFLGHFQLRDAMILNLLGFKASTRTHTRMRRSLPLRVHSVSSGLPIESCR